MKNITNLTDDKVKEIKRRAKLKVSKDKLKLNTKSKAKSFLTSEEAIELEAGMWISIKDNRTITALVLHKPQLVAYGNEFRPFLSCWDGHTGKLCTVVFQPNIIKVIGRLKIPKI